MEDLQQIARVDSAVNSVGDHGCDLIVIFNDL